MKSESYYVWKVRSECEDSKGRLLIPHADPELYEDAFDYLFDSAEEAIDKLEEFGVLKEAIEEKWVLCLETLTPLCPQPELLEGI